MKTILLKCLEKSTEQQQQQTTCLQQQVIGGEQKTVFFSYIMRNPELSSPALVQRLRNVDKDQMFLLYLP